MGGTLFCDLEIRSEHRPSPQFWWPLVFEAMHCAGLLFSGPSPDDRQGTYLDWPDDDVDDAEFVRGPFRSMWERVYSGGWDAVVSFWPSTGEAYPTDVEIRRGESPERVYIRLALEDADLLDIPVPSIQDRLSKWIAAIKEVYGQCGPGTAEIYWTKHLPRDFMWGTIGKPLQLPSSTERASIQSDAPWHIYRDALPDGQSLCLLNPAPVPGYHGWRYVPIVR